MTILIVDDDEVSVMAIRRALERHDVHCPIQVAGDGLEALELLRDRAIKKPYVILLDINMPRMTGLEFLKVAREDPRLKDAVVFIMTTSDMPQDVCAAYAHHVAGYILKEDAYSSIGKAIEMLQSYLGIVVLPTN